MIPVYKPYLTEESVYFATEAIKTGWWSPLGEYKELSREKFLDILEASNTHNCLLVNNGTCGLHLAIKAIKKFYPNIRKAIVPSNVYVAAWNCLLFDDPNYFQLKFLDAHPETWNADYSNLELDNQGEGYLFLIVHNLGLPVKINDLKKKWPKAIFVEDACEAFGGWYDSWEDGRVKSVGLNCEISVFSFFGNKNVTCGEGGAVITANKEMYQYMMHLHGQAQTEQRYLHDDIGYNYRMTNVAAALLQGQLLNWSSIKLAKEDIFNHYLHNINPEKFTFQRQNGHSKWMFGIKTIGNYCDLNYVKHRLEENNIEWRPMFYPFWCHSHLQKYDLGPVWTQKYPNSYNLSRECIIIPSYPDLINEPENLEHIVRTLNGC